MTAAPNPLRPAAAVAFRAWRDLVAATAAQVGRLREEAEGEDFYRPRVGAFRGGHRSPPEFAPLLDLLRPDETWLDIGAGAGRYAIPLAHHVGRVVAVEPSPCLLSERGAT